MLPGTPLMPVLRLRTLKAIPTAETTGSWVAFSKPVNKPLLGNKPNLNANANWSGRHGNVPSRHRRRPPRRRPHRLTTMGTMRPRWLTSLRTTATHGPLVLLPLARVLPRSQQQALETPKPRSQQSNRLVRSLLTHPRHTPTNVASVVLVCYLELSQSSQRSSW